MKAIGRFLLFTILFAAMSLSDANTFSEENKRVFLNRIFELHNIFRSNLEEPVPPLERSSEMDEIGKTILTNYINHKIRRLLPMYGVLGFSRKYDDNTKLDNAEAEYIFTGWFLESLSYVYPNDPPNKRAAGSKNIVWKDTEEIGLAVEQADDCYIVIALYKPAFKMADPAPSDSKTPVYGYLTIRKIED